MPTLMPADTRAVLGADAEKCESRSLLMDRFARPDAKEEDRRTWFERLTRKVPVTITRRALTSETDQAPIYAQLQSRLMVNMAGGVMENAGLCLDRFGMPYIPGSTVKGCARRMALAALHEWCEAGGQPAHKPSGADNPCAEPCHAFASPAEMLAAIARVFGWCEQDWSSAKSDFAWACVPHWQSIRKQTLRLLGDDSTPNATVDRTGASSTEASSHVPRVRTYAGSVSFLPASLANLGKTGTLEGFPHALPQLGQLELDVVTCHHPAYYADRSGAAKATDTEDPIPVLFPAVAPGHVFAFPVLPLRNAPDRSVTCANARCWLAAGLGAFGLGAKTNAGYGWFDASEAIQRAAHDTILERERLEAQRQREAAIAAALALKVAADSKRREELKAAMALLTDQEKEDYKLAQLSEDQFRSRLNDFQNRDRLEKEAMVRSLRLPADQDGSKRKFWDDLKTKALKGGKPAQIAEAIRQTSKQLYAGREGKMP